MADPKQRYERMVARGEERDPRSYEEFLTLDRKEEALFRVEEAGQQAQYTVANDGTLDDLHRAIDGLVKDRGILEE
jgi:dephospho-CoA kinase